MLLQPDKSYLFLATIKEVEAHEAISNWKLMRNSEVKNKQKIKMGNSRLFIHLVFQAQEIPR